MLRKIPSLALHEFRSGRTHSFCIRRVFSSVAPRVARVAHPNRPYAVNGPRAERKRLLSDPSVRHSDEGLARASAGMALVAVALGGHSWPRGGSHIPEARGNGAE